MKTIDVTTPEGNVFCILGFAKSYQRQLKKEGINNKDLDLDNLIFIGITLKN